MRTVAAALAVTVFAVAPALAAGDAAEGQRIATRWCSGCHAAAGAGADSAPPLASIATARARSAEYFLAWLSNPHPAMPDLQLSRQEIADVIAYLRSLGTK